MFDVFGPVRGLLKIDTVCIDNNVFRLHRKATVAILVAFSLIVTSRQYIGDPIDCLVGDAVPSHVMDTYCWIYSTFTVSGAGGAGAGAAHPGVGPEGRAADKRYHKYYQWVCFVLFVQAAFFYAPGYLWKVWEGGRVRALVADLDRPIAADARGRDDRRRLLADYFVGNMHAHGTYALRFFACELLNLGNVLFQMALVDHFLEGEFRVYGLDVFRFVLVDDPDQRPDPMARVFPKVAKCTFRRYGPSGSLHTVDGLCLLPLNIVNEKVYVFLWFWFLLLAAVTAAHLAYRAAVAAVPALRLWSFRAGARLADRKHARAVVARCRVGDWFVLCQLSKNIDPLVFKELLADLADRLSDNDSGSAAAAAAESVDLQALI